MRRADASWLSIYLDSVPRADGRVHVLANITALGLGMSAQVADRRDPPLLND